MKKIILLVLLLSMAFLYAESVSFETSIGNFKMTVENSGSSTTEVTSSDIDVAAEVAKRIEYFEKNYFAKLNKLEQKRATKIADEIYELLALLPENITLDIQTTNTNENQSQSANFNMNVNINEQVEEKVEEETQKNPMSNSDFSQLLQNISAESFADDKLSVLEMAINRHYFTVNQTVQILNVFTYAEDKVEVVRKIAAKIVDLENSHNLLNAFTFSDDKDEVRSIINKY